MTDRLNGKAKIEQSSFSDIPIPECLRQNAAYSWLVYAAENGNNGPIPNVGTSLRHAVFISLLTGWRRFFTHPRIL